LTKKPKAHSGEEIASSINIDGKTCRRLKLDPCFSPCTNINSKWIKDFNIRVETLKLQEVIRNTDIGNDFLNRTQNAQQAREKMNKWDCIKQKTCTAKETATRLKRQPTEWEKIFANCSANKELKSRIYRELKNSTPKELTSQ
jgi:hypothetical protein